MQGILKQEYFCQGLQRFVGLLHLQSFVALSRCSTVDSARCPTATIYSYVESEQNILETVILEHISNNISIFFTPCAKKTTAIFRATAALKKNVTRDVIKR